MSTVYLHIGTPKTGTTYLQNVLNNNNKVLNKYGYTYPDFDVKIPNSSVLRNAHFLIPQFFDENGNRQPEKEREVYEKCMSKLKDLSEEYDNIIISDEMLWVKNELNWSDFKADIDKLGLDIKIIVYLRRQDLYLQSYWSQLVKLHSRVAIDNYLKAGRYKKNVGLDYFAQLNFLSDIFGKENIIARVYEKQQYQGKHNTLLSDFLMSVGLTDLDENEEFEEFKNPKYGAKNPSLSGVYLETKRFLNMNPIFTTRNNYVVPILYSIMDDNSELKELSSSQYMSYDEQVKFLSEYEESNKNVAVHYLNREDGVLFRDKLDPNTVAHNKYTTKEIVNVCGQIIDKQHTDKINDQKKIKELNAKIEKLNAKVKKQQSTINWMSASFPTKVKRKLKHIFKSK